MSAPPRALPTMAATGFQRGAEPAVGPATVGGAVAGPPVGGSGAPGGGGGSWGDWAVGGAAGIAVGGWSLPGGGGGRGVSLMGRVSDPKVRAGSERGWGVGEIIGG